MRAADRATCRGVGCQPLNRKSRAETSTSESDMTARLMHNSRLECPVRASTHRASVPALRGRNALQSTTAPGARLLAWQFVFSVVVRVQLVKCTFGALTSKTTLMVLSFHLFVCVYVCLTQGTRRSIGPNQWTRHTWSLWFDSAAETVRSYSARRLQGADGRRLPKQVPKLGIQFLRILTVSGSAASDLATLRNSPVRP